MLDFRIFCHSRLRPFVSVALSSPEQLQYMPAKFSQQIEFSDVNTEVGGFNKGVSLSFLPPFLFLLPSLRIYYWQVNVRVLLSNWLTSDWL